MKAIVRPTLLPLVLMVSWTVLRMNVQQEVAMALALVNLPPLRGLWLSHQDCGNCRCLRVLAVAGAVVMTLVRVG